MELLLFDMIRRAAYPVLHGQSQPLLQDTQILGPSILQW